MSITDINAKRDRAENVSEDVQKIIDLIENLKGQKTEVKIAAIEALAAMNATPQWVG